MDASGPGGERADYARLVDHLADFWVAARAAAAAARGIGRELDRWNAMPRTGRIFINGVESIMTTPTTPTDIPDDDVPAVVAWEDRLGGAVPNANTTTTWSAEDESGGASTAVSVAADTANDERAMVTFNASRGQFKVVATTQGSGGPVRAESILYNIVPGAVRIGHIQVNPV